MKKAFKWIGMALLTPILLFVLLSALFYFPPFQNWAVRQMTQYASEKTGMDISVGHVRLEFPFELGVEDVRIVKKEEHAAASRQLSRDTIADIRKVIVSVQLRPLLRRQVVVDELTFEEAKLNTNGFIDAARVKGAVGKLRVTNSQIDGLFGNGASNLNIDHALLADARLDVALADSIPEDTTQNETNWRIILNQLAVSNTGIVIHMPGDSVSAETYLGKTTVTEGLFDLQKGVYQVGTMDLTNGRVGYGDVKLTAFNMKADSISFLSGGEAASDQQLKANLVFLSFKEKSGIELRNASGQLAMNSGRFMFKNAKAETSESTFSADLDMALDAFSDVNPGTMKATVQASVGKKDLMWFMEGMPSAFLRGWPNRRLEVAGVLRGNRQNMIFSELTVTLPASFHVKAAGNMQHLDNLEHLKANVSFDARGGNLDFLRELLPADVKKNISIPRGLAAVGNIQADGTKYAATVNASANGNKLQGTVKMDTGKMAYEADLKADIKDFKYGDYQLAGMTAEATVRRNRAKATIHSNNDMLKGVLTIDALTGGNRTRGTIVTDLSKADFRKLRLTDSEITVGGCAHLDFDTDLRDNHRIQGALSELTVTIPQTDSGTSEVYRPGDMWIDLLARRDTTHVIVDSDDLHLALNASAGYERLLHAGDQVLEEMRRQYNEKQIDQLRLRKQFPEAQISISSGRNNFLVKLMNRKGYDVGTVNGRMSSSPTEGLNGQFYIESLLVDSILIDTIRFAIVSDSVRSTYQVQIRNNEKNPQYTFNALIDGVVNPKGTIFGTRLFDEKGDMIVRLGVIAEMDDRGFMFHSYGKEPILGYKTFHINEDNYVYLGNDSRVTADVTLRADDGTGVQIYTDNTNDNALQDITFSLYHFDLAKTLSVLPYTPDVSGMLNGDFHLIQTEKELSVSSNIEVTDLAYEKSPMGDLRTEFVYMPQTGGGHYVDGILFRYGEEIATLNGTYNQQGKGILDAELDLVRLPLSLVNGFVPDQLVGLEGYGEGTLSINGPFSHLDVDGEVFLDSAYLVSAPYGIRMRFDNDPVTIKDSRLLLENFNMYANNGSELTTYGFLDFSNTDRMWLDMQIRAQNFLLIDAKENARSEAYGKAYVNFFGKMSGELTNLMLRGRLSVLGSTDLVYILRDSPLTTDNQFDELVQFTDFNDTTQAVITRPSLTGFSMDMTVDVSKGAHVMAYLNAEKSNYIDLMGGGTLGMLYNTTDGLRLTGRYTLANGEMKYSLPIIPLKSFTIQDGSYIEFRGDPMNPALNITATEKVRTTVSAANGVGRSVNFDCGVIITKTLNDMGLEFTLDAPEDMQLHSELQTMSVEQRGKLAVTMLTTGMYLADGNTNSFSMNNALNSFLQSEINNITGNALHTLDFSLGLDNTTDATGAMSTNYSFKFAKRFWDNRLKISIGGKVSTNNDIQDHDQSFFDNVTFEYRLDDTANKYVTLFYKNNVYDWLDGYTQEFGAGFTWRRTLQHFKDVFRREKNRMIPQKKEVEEQKNDNHQDTGLNE